MPGPANVIVLAEDIRASNFLRRYAERVLDVRGNRVRVVIAPRGAGDAKDFVLKRYVEEVRELRSAHASRCVILHLDADRSSVADRLAQLADALRANGLEPRGDQEPIAHVIMARHVESWLAALTGKTVDPDGHPLDESFDCKRRHFPSSPDALIRDAVARLFALTRLNGPPSPLPSIAAAILELRRIEL